jgi:hypothetical protein
MSVSHNQVPGDGQGCQKSNLSKYVHGIHQVRAPCIQPIYRPKHTQRRLHWKVKTTLASFSFDACTKDMLLEARLSGSMLPSPISSSPRIVIPQYDSDHKSAIGRNQDAYPRRNRTLPYTSQKQAAPVTFGYIAARTLRVWGKHG